MDEKLKFDLKKVMLIATEDYLNTPMHLAAMYNQMACFEVMFSKNLGDPYMLN